MSEKVFGVLLGLSIAAFIPAAVIMQGAAYLLFFVVVYVIWNIK